MMELLPLVPPLLVVWACFVPKPIAAAMLMAAFWLAGAMLGGLVRDEEDGR